MSDTVYDLEERTWKFARDVRALARELPFSLANQVDLKQLLRASGSVGANYLEANNSITPRDFRYEISLCLKEAKESGYWLRLLHTSETSQRTRLRKVQLLDESDQLVRIFSTILKSSSSSKS